METGWLAAMVPLAYDGTGLGLTAATVIMEEINRGGGNACEVHGQMYIMGTLLQRQQGAEGQIPARHRNWQVTQPVDGGD
jgi:acyl-CoA dehydrogenase